MKILLLALLLIAAPAFGAATITIPVGTTNFGPLSVNVADKYSDFSFDRTLWTDPAVTLAANIEQSFDSGKTWGFFCGFHAQGGVTETPTTRIVCSISPGATHVRGNVVVTGGTITLPKPSDFHTK
jgi:hypothetical protein